MIKNVQKGKHLLAPFPWVGFVLSNSDIMAALNDSPLSLQRLSSGEFVGKAFGIKLRIEELEKECNETHGRIRVVSHIRLPFGLGGTYTIANQTYYAIDDHITSFELELRLETHGFASLYFLIKKRSVDAYLDRVCSDIEMAATMLTAEDSSVDLLLDEEQKSRVSEHRGRIERAKAFSAAKTPGTEASLRMSLVQDTVLVEAEARMPDEQLLIADIEVGDHRNIFTKFMESAKRLALINNPTFVIRGEKPCELLDVDFREMAFEFGHSLYKKYFSGDLNHVMPILTHQRESAIVYFDVDEDMDALPWEALNDGRDFLALTVRFVRSLGPSHQLSGKMFNRKGGHGVLLIGADSRGDLPGAITEVESIATALSEAGQKTVEVLTGPQANRRHVLDLLGSGRFNILHFSGHSVFDAEHPYQSCLELEQGTKLRLHELDYLNRSSGTSNPVDLVFLNSCQSGRVGFDKATNRNLSMCRVLRESGVDNVIGMLWNVSDEAAVQVASTFYRLLSTGGQTDIAEAMRQTRCQVALERAWADGSWLAPVLYG